MKREIAAEIGPKDFFKWLLVTLKRMNILFDIIHPAHVHLFRHLIEHLKANKHKVTIVSRNNKDVTCDLLDHYGFEHISISSAGMNIRELASEALQRNIKILSFHLKRRFDISFGTTFSIAHLSTISNVRSFVV